MAQVSLGQVIEQLNEKFDSDRRKLIFWYDEKAEFMSDIDSIKLDNAKVFKLEERAQFRAKYFFEHEDKENNYLIYAPFSKPSLMDDHLADIVRYSQVYEADKISIIVNDLGIEAKYKGVIAHYHKFFASKERTQKFYDLEIDNFDEQVIETALMSVVCKTKVVSFEEIVKTIVLDLGYENSKFLAEFEKYDLIRPFWRRCSDVFGYREGYKSSNVDGLNKADFVEIEKKGNVVEEREFFVFDYSKCIVQKLIYTMFVTYGEKIIGSKFDKALEPFSSNKFGNIIAFLDSLMNSVIYREGFDVLAKDVSAALEMERRIKNIDISKVLDLDIFECVDRVIVNWINERLISEDTAANIKGHNIADICKYRRKKHYGKVYGAYYYVLENAYYIIKSAKFEAKSKAEDIISSYVENDYIIDQRYRYFYYHYDRLEYSENYDRLRLLVENIYTNRYLDPLSSAWSNAFTKSNGKVNIVKQRMFYDKFVKVTKERTIVIVSDGLRFEVAQSLAKRINEDERCEASIMPMLGVIPSYTRFGMSALLPHKTLCMSEDYKVLVDDKVCDDLKSREKIIKEYVPNSKAVQFDMIRSVKDAKELTTGQELVYVYHNQIDARGDKLVTENEVFNACEEAVEEIYSMIKRLTSASNSRFIITADHGFIYKRDRLGESDKISGFEKDGNFVGRRYVISDNPIMGDGIKHISLGEVLGNDDKKVVSLPMGSDVFKVKNDGCNYVHGGASLQEIIIPVIDIKTSKYGMDTKPVDIAIISLIKKITNITTNIDFIQTDAVTDVNKETVYKIFFAHENGEIISNENKYVADKKDDDASKRVFRLKFTFKNKQYLRSEKYYLVAYDDVRNVETMRYEIQMDLTFTDDYGF